MDNIYRIFVSMPMHEKNEAEIRDMLNEVKDHIEELKNTKPDKYTTKEVTFLYEALNRYPMYEVICTIDWPTLPNEVVNNSNEPRLKYLARSINILADCNAAIFCPGWIKAAGCNVEFATCKLYYIPTFELCEWSKSAERKYFIKGLKG